MNSKGTWVPVDLDAGTAPPAGAFSIAAQAEGLIFVSGQVPRHPETGEWERAGTFEEQARRVFGNLELAVRAAGAWMTDVVAVTIYLGDIEYWGRMNELFQEVFDPPYPTRTIVGAQLEGFLVEASAVAVKPPTTG